MFPGHVSEWSSDQTRFAHWMQFYDGIYQSLDCPDEWIIQDNHLLDKWWAAKLDEFEKDKKGRKSGNKGRSALAHDVVTLY